MFSNELESNSIDIKNVMEDSGQRMDSQAEMLRSSCHGKNDSLQNVANSNLDRQDGND